MDFDVTQRVLDMLEWGPLEDALADGAMTPAGRRLARARSWAADAEVETRLDEVTEARALLAEGAVPPIGGVQDLEPHLAQAARGSVLGGVELLAVGDLLGASNLARETLRRRREDAPRLAELAEAVPDLADLEREIRDAIDRHGGILDDASPSLATARREAQSLATRIQKQIVAAMASPRYAPHLQDHFYTLRGERYVLPIRIEARARVRGIVHDVSASGTTVFVEPEEIVDLNNRLRFAELEVERESMRILAALTARVAQVLDAIRLTIEVLAGIDLVFARARLSDRLRATRPGIVPEPRLRLLAARHPALALAGAAVVPNDIAIGEAYQALVLSGPNAGGKTVALKTAGLAVLMVRAGLHLPVEAGSRVGLFRRVHADIGDDQDLSASLSTFSGQIAQMVRFLGDADPRTLVLLDEIAVGTDPVEGAALAQALLEALIARGARVIVTTHYQPLKDLAAGDPRFQNACMEIDDRTLRLTYRMIPGVPGRSGALDIAGKLGLEPGIVGRARSLLGTDRQAMEASLRRLEELRIDLEAQKREAARMRAESEEAKRAWTARLRQIERERERISKELKAALDARVRSAQEEIAEVIRNLQRRGTAQEADVARRRIVWLRDQVEEAIPPPLPPSEDPIDWTRVAPGTRVRLTRFGAEGELVERPDASGHAQVRVGGKRLVVPARDLALAAAPAPAPSAPRPAEPRWTDDLTPPAAGTLDVRGMRAEDAQARLVYFLDRLYAAGEKTAFLVHGHGTGALKTSLRAYLAECPYVASFRSADPHRGGDGVTVIRIRE